MRTNATERPESRSNERAPSGPQTGAPGHAGAMNPLRRFWKRRVRGRPDRYQAYLAFPTETDRPRVGEVHDRIEELEHAFEGRLDVYARLRSVAVVTDPVPFETFDVTGFEAILESIEDDYASTHRLARLEKWRSLDGRLVKSYVVVPVKPLFPRETAESSKRVPSPAD